MSAFEVPTTSGAPTTTTTAAPTTTTTAPPPTTTAPLEENLKVTASEATASGDFTSDGEGMGVPEGTGSGMTGPSTTSSKVEFTFTVTDEDDYTLRAKVMGPDSGSDSFWVTINGLPSEGYLWDTRRDDDYKDDYVNDRGGADPVIVHLEPGQHTVTVYFGEDGAYLKQIELKTA